MSIALWIVVAVVLALAGAAARRFMGGWGGKNPRWLHLAAVGSLTGLATAFGVDRLGLDLWLGSAYVLMATVAAAGVASTGDGDGTDLGEWEGAEPDQPFWSWLVGSSDNTLPFDARYWHDAKTLLFSGAAQTSVAGLLVAFAGRPFVGTALMLSGALKYPAYALAYKVPSTVRNFHQGRELGEAFWGATLGLIAAAVAVVVYA